MHNFEESRRKSQQTLIKEHKNYVTTVRLSEKNKHFLSLNEQYEKLTIGLYLGASIYEANSYIAK